MRKGILLFFVSVLLLSCNSLQTKNTVPAVTDAHSKTPIPAFTQVPVQNIVVATKPTDILKMGKNIIEYMSNYELLEPGTHTDYAYIDSSQPYSISVHMWCSWNEEMLAENLRSIKLDIIINDSPVSPDNILKGISNTFPGDDCTTWHTNLSGFEKNTLTTIVLRAVLEKSVNNGRHLYPPGIYDRIFALRTEK